MRYNFRRFITLDNVKRSRWYLKQHGLAELVRKFWQKLKLAFISVELANISPAEYRRWIERNEPTTSELNQEEEVRFRKKPLIDLIVPCYKTPAVFIHELIDSVKKQTYSSWRLNMGIVIEDETLLALLEQESVNEPRIKIIKLQQNLGISGNTNAIVKKAKGDFVAFLDHDDTLAPNALFEVVSVINRSPNADVIYSDEDKLTENGQLRHSPHFKSDWNPDLLRSFNYITHLLVIKRSLLDDIGSLDPSKDGAQDYDLVLRATEKSSVIIHIPKILYHWRESAQSTAANPLAKRNIEEKTLACLCWHLERIKRRGLVTAGPLIGSARVNYYISSYPLISIIIPNKDHADDLARCVDSILSKTSYPNYEIIIMENHSYTREIVELYNKLQSDPRIRVIKWSKEFNYSEINNDSLKVALGSVLLFLNNDMEVINSDWLEQLYQHLQWEQNGVVGAKLFYPDLTIQHAGIVIGIGGIAGHVHKHFTSNSTGYFGRLTSIQDVSAVTGACLMVKRDIFQQVGGFDQKYPLAFNDVDLCLSVRLKGYNVVWTPYAQLIHHESKTRGLEDTAEKVARFGKEVKYFEKKWGDLLKRGDPYYNPNLTLEREDLSLKK